ncbi:MAG: 2-C-methyl-D-erythritol 4-phosphate cytidylyltransferase [Bacteroidales bacterium]|nr:2-C-methyl-D-erythritol 4-phosphate cytidylyltransferase [Bacteroidales bacterium]
MKKTTAILLAAGKSERFKNKKLKPFLLLNNKAVYRYSLDVFLAHHKIDTIILVLPEDLLLSEKERFKKEVLPKTVKLIAGGKTRFESVKNALSILNDSAENILIHDAARPFINNLLIDNCLLKLKQEKAVSCAIKSTDTIVFTNKDKLAVSYPERDNIMRIQTPQAFKTDILKTAYSLATKERKTNFTDDSSLIQYYNLASVYLVSGSEENIKITYTVDFLLAKQLLEKP